MADTNPKPKQGSRPSLLRQLFESGAFIPRAAGSYDVLKNVAKGVNMRINENLAKNLDPYTYGASGVQTGQEGMMDKLSFITGAAKKYAKAGILNIKDPGRAMLEQNPSNQDMLRMDLLNIYAGKPQTYNTALKSEYKPSTSKDANKQYYKSKESEEDLLLALLDGNALNKLSKGITSKKDLEEAFSAKGKKVGTGYQRTVSGLGTATVGFGEDEKGPYVSYYDKWDLNPASGKSSALKLGKSADEFITGLTESLGATPAEVYNRIYFDKKTGKPISPEYQEIFNKAVSNAKEAELANTGESSWTTGKPITGGFSGLKKKKK
jgi:hypothetical protein